MWEIYVSIVVFIVSSVIFIYGPNLYRVLTFWSWAWRPVIAYCYLYFMNKYKFMDSKLYERKWQDCHIFYAPRFYDMCVAMKGFLVKSAQVLHSRPDITVPVFHEMCGKFLNTCPHECWSAVRNIIQQELGMPIEDVFLELEETPLGAASVAQAHRGVLQDGTKVVIKVQYPWAQSLFHVDLGNMLIICYWLNYTIYKELKGALEMYENELDFEKEAETIRFFWEKIGSNPDLDVRTPRPIDEYCTSKVIVMTLLEGEPLSKYLNEHLASLTADLGVDKLDMTKADFNEFTPPDETQLKVINGVVSVRQKCWNALAKGVNKSFGNLFRGLGRKSSTIVEYKRTLPINPEEIVKTLIDVMGYQFLVLGRFTTDPHAGNILVDKNGKLGLIDFGQSWEAPKADMKLFAKVLEATKSRDRRATARAFKTMGFSTVNDNMDCIFLIAVFLFDQLDYRLAEEILGTKDKQEMLEKFLEKDDLKDFPPRFHAFVRPCMIIRGLALHFLCSPSLAKCWEGYIDDLLNEGRPRKRTLSLFKQTPRRSGRASTTDRFTALMLRLCPVLLPKSELSMVLSR